MDSASQSNVCDTSQLSTSTGSETTFFVAHTKKAEHTPTNGQWSSDYRHRYRGVYHPPATGDGHPH